MITPEVYSEFRDDVLEVIGNQELFTKPKIKVLIKQMVIGKSYFQGKELSPELYKVFYNQKFNIRVAPKNETCNDGIFEKETIVDGKKYRYRDITHIKDSSMMDEFCLIVLTQITSIFFQSLMLDFQITLVFFSMLKYCSLD